MTNGTKRDTISLLIWSFLFPLQQLLGQEGKMSTGEKWDFSVFGDPPKQASVGKRYIAMGTIVYFLNKMKHEYFDLF